ncbi:MAG: sugar phosphate nucleotidyltransferase [Acidimicrobiales bacterium]
MRAVLLVGGQGTRLRPLTLAVPKQLLAVAEVPMIHRILAYLADHGVTDAVLSLGYRHADFVAAMPGARSLGFTVLPAVEPDPRGTAGAVLFAARLAGIDEPFLVLNGDILTDIDLGALVAFHRDRGAEATLALTPVDDPSSFGLVATDDHGRVAAFIEKPVVAQPAGPDGPLVASMVPPAPVAPSTVVSTAAEPNHVNSGLYVLEPSVLDRIPDDRPVSIEREVFPAMVTDGTLFALPSPAYWTDTGTPERFLAASLDLVSGRRPGPPAPDAADRGDGVWTIGSAVVDGEVRPPALVGTAAFVQAGAVVERSVVGAGARVHEGAEVRGSVLLAGAVVRADAVVEGCLVGEHAVIGEKARLSDLAVVGPGVSVEPEATLAGVRVPAGG